MQPRSRRSLLTATGSVLALGAAGCLGVTEPSDSDATPTAESTPDDGDGHIPDGLERGFQYLRPPGDEGVVARISRPSNEQAPNVAFSRPYVTDQSTLEWALSVRYGTEENGTNGLVATGSHEVDTDADAVTPDGSSGRFDRYVLRGEDRDGSRVLASDGDVFLLGTASWVDGAIDTATSDAETYLDARPDVRALLEAIDVDGGTSLFDGRSQIERTLGEIDGDTTPRPDVLAIEVQRASDRLSYAVGGRFADAPDADAVASIETLATELGVGNEEDPTVTVDEDDRTVTVEGTRPYTPPEERPETARLGRFVEYDADSGELLFAVRSGDPLPVDRYDLGIEDEAYDGDWHRGRDEIGAGDRIALDANAVEPGDSVALSYDAPDGSYGSSSGTSVLRQLPFDIDFDPDAGTATITYADGPPLPADRLQVVVGEDGNGRRPWSGDLTAGDEVTVDGLSLDSHLTVEYRRTDGETVQIGHAFLTPPGTFTFDYDAPSETVTVTYPTRDRDDTARHPANSGPVSDRESLTASRYELRIEDEPASKQWTAVNDEIEPGDSLTVGGVPTDTAVAVHWIDQAGQRHEVDRIVTIPDATFSFDFDADAGTVTITHAGGPPVPADRLVAKVLIDEREVRWADSGTTSGDQVTAGDELVVQDVTDHSPVMILYVPSDGRRRVLDQGRAVPSQSE